MGNINYKVNQNPTKQEFENMKYLDRRIFLTTAEERFSKLDSDYLSKKVMDEKFPAEGNNKLSLFIEQYLNENITYFRKKDLITLLDLGSAGGALSTIFAIRALHNFKLLNKTRIILVDVAEDALKTTLKGKFTLPESFLAEYGLENFNNSKLNLKKILFKSSYHCEDIINLPAQLKEIDICISGFTHHHLNIFDKQSACKEMERVARVGGFVGVTDESLTYEAYLQWLKDHSNEKNSRGEDVPIAQESFISINEHQKFFPNLEIKDAFEDNEYYCFYGVKK